MRFRPSSIGLVGPSKSITWPELVIRCKSSVAFMNFHFDDYLANCANPDMSEYSLQCYRNFRRNLRLLVRRLGVGLDEPKVLIDKSSGTLSHQKKVLMMMQTELSNVNPSQVTLYELAFGLRIMVERYFREVFVK